MDAVSRRRSGSRPLRVTLVVALMFGMSTWSLPADHGPRAVADVRPRPKWDRRVAELAAFVEHRRGLDFHHPVPVRFMSDAQFKKRVTATRHGLSRHDIEGLENTAGTLRALGLSQSRADKLLEQINEGAAHTVLAFYDPKDKEVFVRGRELDIATKVTVVHELTHVAQDQSFDLTKLFEKARSGGALAVSALVEGDAMRIEADYVQGLSGADREAYVAGSTKQAEALGDGSGPEMLRLLGGAPYQLGPALVSTIQETRGEQGIDAAFRKPPTSDEHVLAPSTYVDGDNPKRVDPPTLAPGERMVGRPETFGALALFATLMWRLPPEVALNAALGWGGDSLVRFELGGRNCLVAAFTGDTPNDTNEITTALEDWAPRGTAQARVSRSADGNVATLRTCDPFAGTIDESIVRDGEIKLRNGEALLAARAFFMSTELRSGTPTQAQCAADRLALDPLVRTFFESGTAPTEQQSKEISGKVESARSGCGL